VSLVLPKNDPDRIRSQRLVPGAARFLTSAGHRLRLTEGRGRETASNLAPPFAALVDEEGI